MTIVGGLYGSYVSEVLVIDSAKMVYSLKFKPIVTDSEVLKADDIPLLRGVDYSINPTLGEITLLQNLKAQDLFVEYIAIPNELLIQYYWYQIRNVSDSLDTQAGARLRDLWMVNDSKLNISGSKTFALTFADDDAFDLKQSLFVNLSGELAENVNIQAQLSDSQSQLSPEGDSKELSSLDQVFFKVYGRQYEIAMGDLELDYRYGRFLNYQTKFEGINLQYQDKHKIQAAYSASNGKRASMQIEIIDGKQGPYFLSAGGFQQSFMVVAGSERVYIDGAILDRGMDYSIEYSDGSITFKNLVSSNNRVIVDFQYSDEFYKQNMYLSSSKIQIWDKVFLSHYTIHQADDKAQPLQYEFSEDDLDSLRVAGDREVWGNGVIQVDSGSGTYKLMFDEQGIEYYEYAPLDSLAIYNVVFSFVGFGNGSYEEYSSGKYRYTGQGFGSYIPQKRLKPPSQRSNINLNLAFESDQFDLGIQTLLSEEDKNTYSALDDSDNRSLLWYGFSTWKPELDRLKPIIRFDISGMGKGSYLFGNYSDPATDQEFGNTSSADSLQQIESNLEGSIELYSVWNPSLLLNYRDVKGLFVQRAVRLRSRLLQQKMFPEVNLSTAFTKQAYADNPEKDTEYQYHTGNLGWQYKSLSSRLEGIYSSNELKADALDIYSGTRYWKWGKTLGVGDKKRSSSTLSYSFDQNELKTNTWKKLNSSQTYSLKHTSSYQYHSADISISHREIADHSSDENGTKSNYDLINLSSSHHFLKQAISLLSNYRLNQIEFFPKIRELEFVGSGQGQYDSTGVYISGGDYDYVYISSENGTLSTEINASLNLYLKPANVSSHPILQRLMYDSNIQATEQSEGAEGYSHYFFFPSSVYNSDNTIYGRQSLQQNLWIDLIRNRLTTQIQYDISRSLDQRYQDQSRTFSRLLATEIEIKQLYQNNVRIRMEQRNDEDSRYQSLIKQETFAIALMRNLNPNSVLQLDLDISGEDGSSSNSTDEYRIFSYSLKPTFRSVWMQNYRVSASVTARLNDRKGSEYLSFLPDKRDGFMGLWNIQAIYRLNHFSSASLEYSGNAYPQDKTKHQLKIEFKAEL